VLVRATALMVKPTLAGAAGAVVAATLQGLGLLAARASSSSVTQQQHLLL